MTLHYYFLRALQKIKLLKYFNFTMRSAYAGKQFYIPVSNGIGISNLHTTEGWMKELIRKLLMLKNGVVIDVGVNIGQTLMKLRSFSSARYIGIEPNPECVVYVEDLVQKNNIENCTICPVGLGNENTLLTLYGDTPAATGASMIKGFREDVKRANKHTHVISVIKGEDLLKSLQLDESIALIKIDVEGAELEVLEGLRGILSTRPFIVCEILPVYSLKKPNGKFRKERQDKVVALLKSCNYSIFRVIDQRQFDLLTDIEVHGNMDFTNYVFVPKEMKDKFLEIILRN